MSQEGNSSGPWPREMHHNALTGVEEEDFTNFLDLENGFDAYQQQINDSDGHMALETPMGRLAFGQDIIQDMTGHDTTMLQQINMSMGGSHGATNFADVRQNNQAQEFQQYQMYQQMNASQNFQVPPTPVSAEMHANKYMSQVENVGQLLFERNQASFTPLVSPAQTPLDNVWNLSDYVGADDFFSPLTSPAIEAQATFASTNATASPVDLNVDTSAVHTPVATGRRGRRKAQQPQQRNVVRSVRQSPAMKPQSKRRQISVNALPLDKIETMLESSALSDRLQPGSARAATFASSEDSVSPEALSEALMRPPPVPSNARSPMSTMSSHKEDSDIPATPAMLMRMPGKQPANTNRPTSTYGGDVMEDIVLPDAAAAMPQRILPDIGVKPPLEDDQNTPTILAKTPKLNAGSTPRSSAIRSNNNSNDSVEKIKRPETKTGGRASKKRQSISSAAMSPALRPKISPSISPLVPSTGNGMSHLSAETSALYLASKSNYQNILDGTHLPGVSYPEALAENLSSKRTSHKIAEQGRRNRINLALKEIEALLPPSMTGSTKKEKGATSSKENEATSPDAGSGGGQGASKASTVEMAITYIKNLQIELQATKRKLADAEKRIAEGNFSGGSQGSESGTA